MTKYSMDMLLDMVIRSLRGFHEVGYLVSNGTQSLFDFMLPHAYDLPTHIFQSLVDFCIPLNIPGDLGSPVFLIRLRHRSVLGTAVPETAVNEHSDLASGENDVRSAWQFQMESVPQPPLP